MQHKQSKQPSKRASTEIKLTTKQTSKINYKQSSMSHQYTINHNTIKTRKEKQAKKTKQQPQTATNKQLNLK